MIKELHAKLYTIINTGTTILDIALPNRVQGGGSQAIRVVQC